MNKFQTLKAEELQAVKGGLFGRTREVEGKDMNGDGIEDKCITVYDRNGNVIRRTVKYGR